MRLHAASFSYVRLPMCTPGPVASLIYFTIRLHAVDTVRLLVGYPSATTAINDDQPLRNLVKSWEVPHFNLILSRFSLRFLSPFWIPNWLRSAYVRLRRSTCVYVGVECDGRRNKILIGRDTADANVYREIDTPLFSLNQFSKMRARRIAQWSLSLSHTRSRILQSQPKKTCISSEMVNFRRRSEGHIRGEQHVLFEVQLVGVQTSNVFCSVAGYRRNCRAETASTSASMRAGSASMRVSVASMHVNPASMRVIDVITGVLYVLGGTLKWRRGNQYVQSIPPRSKLPEPALRDELPIRLLTARRQGSGFGDSVDGMRVLGPRVYHPDRISPPGPVTAGNSDESNMFRYKLAGCNIRRSNRCALHWKNDELKIAVKQGESEMNSGVWMMALIKMIGDIPSHWNQGDRDKSKEELQITHFNSLRWKWMGHRCDSALQWILIWVSIIQCAPNYEGSLTENPDVDIAEATCDRLK
ncbi:hypothetical protein B0H17DRAFT_1245231 [Mycena rosella]|uniref:Uncharacterized protein n=1 Tax=Mycena rosella TaxID=1033263 RepID=A0AAD7CZK2_MYCRO|nr:hypothetical protein B0H17DRAFT_1245231 [Mycena rosella]